MVPMLVKFPQFSIFKNKNMLTSSLIILSKSIKANYLDKYIMFV